MSSKFRCFPPGDGTRPAPRMVPNGFAVRYNGLSIVDAYTNPQGLYESLRKTARDFGWVFVPRMVVRELKDTASNHGFVSLRLAYPVLP